MSYNAQGQAGAGPTVAGFMEKPTSQAIITALVEGVSIRKAAEMTDTSVNTVQKVKGLIE